MRVVTKPLSSPVLGKILPFLPGFGGSSVVVVGFGLTVVVVVVGSGLAVVVVASVVAVVVVGSGLAVVVVASVVTVVVVGQAHTRIRSTNLLERLNQEVRRREKVVRIFPNTASATRLIGAMLMHQHEDWIGATRTYIKL